MDDDSLCIHRYAPRFAASARGVAVQCGCTVAVNVSCFPVTLTVRYTLAQVSAGGTASSTRTTTCSAVAS
eukprot:6380306-Prorocentrum_lima.AAC.1